MQNIQHILQSVSDASVETRKLSDTQKKEILKELSFQIEQNIDIIVSENQKDLVKMPDADPKKEL